MRLHLTPKRLKWLTAILLPSFMLLLGVWCIFGWGNPQWHPRIYQFQAFTLGRTLSPPAAFTGDWREWNRAGKLIRRTTYHAGVRTTFTVWSADGKVTQRGWITTSGIRLGTRLLYHPSGRPAAEFHTRGDYRYGKATWWNLGGEKIAEGAYINERRWNGTFLLYDEVTRNHIVERYEAGRLQTQILLGAELSERRHD